MTRGGRRWEMPPGIACASTSPSMCRLADTWNCSRNSLRCAVRLNRMNRPIRVSYLIDGLTRAGTETQLLALIKSRDRRRVQPSLVLLDGNDDLSRDLSPPDCPVLTLGVNSLHSGRALRAGAKLARF